MKQNEEKKGRVREKKPDKMKINKINISKKNLKKKIYVGRKNSAKKKFYRPKLSKHDFYS